MSQVHRRPVAPAPFRHRAPPGMALEEGHISETLAGVPLRRTKAAVAKRLPARSDRTLFVPLGDEQRRHHQENAELAGRVVQKWRRPGFLSEEDQRCLTCALQRMRMVCDSTYLVDPRLDEGAKVGELATVLDGFFAETPDDKAVVFSSWLKMHELIVRVLDQRGWGHALFHGGVPTAERGVLVHRFRDNPACRVFLATDAGDVGLNLQWATLVVNADPLWNPAVLEQRIGRVHRPGQNRGVQVVNLVAENSIEPGILTTLAFKRAPAAGILDGVEETVHLGGTRLKRFMERVAQVTAAAATPVPPPVAEAVAETHGSTQDAKVVAASIFQEGMAGHGGAGIPVGVGPTSTGMSASCVRTPAQATAEVLAGAGVVMGGLSRLFAAAEIRRDGDGRDHLHLPLPDPARLEAPRQTLGALAALGAG